VIDLLIGAAVVSAFVFFAVVILVVIAVFAFKKKKATPSSDAPARPTNPVSAIFSGPPANHVDLLYEDLKSRREDRARAEERAKNVRKLEETLWGVDKPSVSTATP